MTGSMDGKVCLVTGATNGIGLVAARELAGLGATTVLVGRDERRGEAAMAEIRKAFPAAKLDFLRADFASQADVRKLADLYRERYPRLDVLLNNAGLIIDSRQVTPDGLEATFAINHLAPFLLTNLLKEVLAGTKGSRVVNVSSEGHRAGKLDFDDLQSQRGYTSVRVYGTSKLANILFTRALARRLEGTGVTTNCLHPGVVATGFGHGYQGAFGFLMRLGRPFFITAEQGARTSVYLSSSPAVEQVTGKYFIKCKEARPSAAARDDAVAERLWDVSAELTKLKA